jgi:hypothetical protein
MMTADDDDSVEWRATTTSGFRAQAHSLAPLAAYRWIEYTKPAWTKKLIKAPISSPRTKTLTSVRTRLSRKLAFSAVVLTSERAWCRVSKMTVSAFGGVRGGGGVEGSAV